MLSSVTQTTLSTGLEGTRALTGPSSAPLVGGSSYVQGTEPLPTDFGTVLGQMAMEAVGTIKAGEATAVAGIRGQATTQQVVESMMAAEQTLQAGIAIRDKVVSAYLEVSRMQI